MQKLEQFNRWLRDNHTEAWAFVMGSGTGALIFSFAALVLSVVFKYGLIAGVLTLLSPWILFLCCYIYKFWKENQ